MSRDPKLDSPYLDTHWKEQQERAESVFSHLRHHDPYALAVANLIDAATRVVRAYTMSDEQAGISGQDELDYAITDVLSGALSQLKTAAGNTNV